VYLSTPIDNLNYIEIALSNAAKRFDIQRKAIKNQLEDFADDEDDFILKMPPPIDPPPSY
jgi:hypothetical protein